MRVIRKSLRKKCEALKKEPQQLGLLLQYKDGRSRVGRVSLLLPPFLSQGILSPSQLLGFPRARAPPGQTRVPLCRRAWAAAVDGPTARWAQAAPGATAHFVLSSAIYWC